MEAETNNLAQKIQQWQSVASNARGKLSFEQTWKTYQNIYENEPLKVAWHPDESTVQSANISELMAQVEVESYADLYQWSIQNRAVFWEAVVRRLNIQLDKPYQQILDDSQGNEQVNWLRGAQLNIAESCFQAPADKPALTLADESGQTETLSYGQLEELVNRVASGLKNLNFKPGDAVALYMPLGKEAVAAYLGIIKAGMAAVLIADSFSSQELSSRLKIAKAKAVITVDAYAYNQKLLNVYSRVKEANTPLAVVVQNQPDTQLRSDDIIWDDFLGETTAETHIGQPDDTISILFSSGTTSEPKAIPWNQLTPIKCAMDGHFHHDIHPNDVVTWTTSMGWMMGPWLIYATLMNQATIALFTGSAASAAFGKFVEETKISILGTIPSLVKVWRASKAMEDYRWSVRVFSSTGEPSNAEDYLYLMWLNNFKAPIIEYCGGTEIGGGYLTGTVVQPAIPATFTTPALGLEIRFRNHETGELDPSQAGEVFIVPPAIGLSQKLLNRDHHEAYYAGSPTLEDGRPLRKHGDNYQVLGELNQTVFYRSQGRADDVMNLGGIKVSAVEIEKVLNQHGVITESAAVAISPPEGGPEQLVVFYLTDRTVEKEPLKKELQKLLSQQLNPLFRIADVVQKDSLPRTASNKLMRRTLRDGYSS
ncbi:AMP-binding protein [Tunicatimonas pelagia]|uniref:AMP-binding protein n=1 Tax=Tunicatimonas pelagia TaxID=931531 RepID=UPI002667021E|nr:AMP-binding protein [Tunicatimonas pelagia]WKN44687.1 AMP-binding protein [Tunicatimonas pelagia]